MKDKPRLLEILSVLLFVLGVFLSIGFSLSYSGLKGYEAIIYHPVKVLVIPSIPISLAFIIYGYLLFKDERENDDDKTGN